MTDDEAVGVVAKAIGVTCGRCRGTGTERHQISRDPADGYADWPCPSCRGEGWTVMYDTPVNVARKAVEALKEAG